MAGEEPSCDETGQQEVLRFAQDDKRAAQMTNPARGYRFR
jgi:hypothetical protein